MFTLYLEIIIQDGSCCLEMIQSNSMFTRKLSWFLSKCLCCWAQPRLSLYVSCAMSDVETPYYSNILFYIFYDNGIFLGKCITFRFSLVQDIGQMKFSLKHWLQCTPHFYLHWHSTPLYISLTLIYFYFWFFLTITSSQISSPWKV